MKNKIILTTVILFALISCSKNINHNHNNSYSGYDHKCTKDELKMSADLVPYFNEFIEDCKLHNINYDHVYCLSYLHFEHNYRVQGVTDFDYKDIAINPALEKDTIGMRFVVYHELGHWMGLEHGDGIMKRSYSTEEDMEWVQNNWNELVEDYFNKLRNHEAELLQ